MANPPKTPGEPFPLALRRPREEGRAAPMGRLVLTPSLRVREPADPDPTASLPEASPPPRPTTPAIEPVLVPTGSIPAPATPDEAVAGPIPDPSAIPPSAASAPDPAPPELPPAAAPPIPAPAEAPAPRPPEPVPLPLAGLDEAALRALVAEVVSEELRGETGARVTRNLRKLVRQEVLQALAMRAAARPPGQT
ncbi:hypothetical protein [Rubellimicrobium aerolatum]|uniref:DUF2497 domain-containing protein n=1 Tax=Rubellimicrobium aerolatum TaxID=490979 RepID=A0ABW0SC22_9RHOB|nr:hypothetical protein [Rubellimicrobium aerolatum]MBP1806212.1 hypothetical protein [Rubellimicrobium aerolatum]